MAAVDIALCNARKHWARNYCRDTAIILRRMIESGEDASHSTDYKPIKTIRCRPMTDDRGAEVEQGEQIVSVMSFKLRFEWGADIKDTDRLQIGNTIYSVVTSDPERADALFLTASCTRVK